MQFSQAEFIVNVNSELYAEHAGTAPGILTAGAIEETIVSISRTCSFSILFGF